MISLRVIDENADHVIIEANERVTIETGTVKGRAIISVYRSDEPEIVGCFDGTITGNKNWRA